MATAIAAIKTVENETHSASEMWADSDAMWNSIAPDPDKRIKVIESLPRYRANEQDRYNAGYMVIYGLIVEGKRYLVWVKGDTAKKLVSWEEVVHYRNWGAKYCIIGRKPGWLKDNRGKFILDSNRNRILEEDERTGLLQYGKFAIVLDPVARDIIGACDPLKMLRSL